MALAENRYCCLDGLPTVADARSAMVWTKAAPGFRAAQLHPEPYR